MTLPLWAPASLEGEEWDLVFPAQTGHESLVLREGPPE